MSTAGRILAYAALAAALTFGFVVTTNAQDRTLIDVIADVTSPLHQPV